MALNNTIAILVFLLVSLGLGVQFAAYMNLDNAWLLHAAERVVSGHKLYVDVMETNPPLIVYINMVAVYLAKGLGISLIHGFILLVGSAIILSLGMAFHLVKDGYMRICLAFGLAFLPAANFGEREHFFMLFLIPYLVSLWQDKKPGTLYLVVSALMAGIAFSLKPFFLIVWGVLMLIQIVMERRLFAFFTLQNVIIGLVVAAYPLYLFFFEKNYIELVLPLAIKYYGGFGEPLKSLVRTAVGSLILAQMAFVILFVKNRAILIKPLYFLSFAHLAAITVVLVQGKTWTNYLYPPGLLTFLANALITYIIFKGDLRPLWNRVAIIISSFVMVVYFTIAVTVSIVNTLGIKDERENKLRDIINQHASGKNIMAISFDLGAAFPAVMHTKAQYSSRYGHLWMLPGMYDGVAAKDMVLEYRKPAEKSTDEAAVTSHVIQDLKTSRPALVIVTASDYYSPGIGNYRFDFIEYFSKDPEFVGIWKQYMKIDEIGEEKGNYRKEIYQLQE